MSECGVYSSVIGHACHTAAEASLSILFVPLTSGSGWMKLGAQEARRSALLCKFLSSEAEESQKRSGVPRLAAGICGTTTLGVLRTVSFYKELFFLVSAESSLVHLGLIFQVVPPPAVVYKSARETVKKYPVGSLPALQGGRFICSEQNTTLCSSATMRKREEPHALSIICKTQSNHPPARQQQSEAAVVVVVVAAVAATAVRGRGSLYKERVKRKAAWQLETGLLTSTHPPSK
ncbi:hypothetical protein L3Q82_020237 [Xyrichtys novacula]|uniref:Uncharacterized protein n=1 Tax=Xyrichtys novacula TaxID=13765 RepID=A0AAV1FEY9_XYRNO|nr:hypothetical protein L3Q82_020237 [Xyrichtys novacula]